MMNSKIIHKNILDSGSRYAANFDYIMHGYCIDRFYDDLKDKRCLELGCYHGELTKRLSNICKHVTAIDNDKKCIEISKNKCNELRNASFIYSDFINFYEYQNYDVIYCSHALEHVVDDFKLLRHINKNISNNQIMITIVPNGQSLSRQIAVNMGLLNSSLEVTTFEKKIGHHRTYDTDSLIDVFRRSGMKIISSGGIMPKIFSNNQFDKCLSLGIIDLEFLNGLNKLSDKYFELCSSIFVISIKE